jgi:hypothetical protein
VPADEQLARILGPAWESMGYETLVTRAHRFEQAAGLVRKLAAYMAETDAATAGEALAALAPHDPRLWPSGGTSTRRPVDA